MHVELKERKKIWNLDDNISLNIIEIDGAFRIRYTENATRYLTKGFLHMWTTTKWRAEFRGNPPWPPRDKTFLAWLDKNAKMLLRYGKLS